MGRCKKWAIKLIKSCSHRFFIKNAISNKEMKQTCFDHNFSKSRNCAASSGILIQFWALLKMQPFAKYGTLPGGTENEKRYFLSFFSESTFIMISARVR